MTKLPSSLEKVINEFSRLPGIGPKTAQRLAFYLLKRDDIDLTSLSASIAQLKQGVIFCSTCHNMASADPCSICTDPLRDQQLLCVVEEPLDALAIDKTGQFKGVFHILGGVLNPMEGIGPDKLNIQTLAKRIEAAAVKEVIVATNPTLEGETTALHISRLLKTTFPELKLTRIARGLPTGGDLEYADEITLLRAMEGRREY
jgi:recombination protein RecR